MCKFGFVISLCVNCNEWDCLSVDLIMSDLCICGFQILLVSVILGVLKFLFVCVCVCELLYGGVCACVYVSFLQ